MRLKSSSDNSQRALTSRALSRATPIAAPTMRKPDCQPQKSSEAPRRKGGGFMKPGEPPTTSLQPPTPNATRSAAFLEVRGWTLVVGCFSSQHRELFFYPPDFQRVQAEMGRIEEQLAVLR